MLRLKIISLVILMLSTSGCASTAVGQVNNCPSGVIEPKYYSELNLEDFPVLLLPENEVEIKDRSAYYEVNICRGNNVPFEVYKIVSGEITFGFEYQYEKNNLVGTRMLFIGGSPTKYRVLKEI